MKLGSDGTEKERSGSAATEPIALVGPVAIVVAHEMILGVLQAAAAGEVPAAEGHAPVLVQDRARQSLDEPVGPGIPRLGAGVPNPQRPTRLIERALELRAAIGQHPLPRPARG